MASITLGGNVSIAAGPVGRNAEAAGAASLKSVAGVFSYSKTKGLFAGVSLEGSILITRHDENKKFYGPNITPHNLLLGDVRPPPAADPLMHVLNSAVFSGRSANDNSMYNDIPIYDDRHDDIVWEGRGGGAYREGVRSSRSNTVNSKGSTDDYEYRDNPSRTKTWTDDIYDRNPHSRTAELDSGAHNRNSVSGYGHSDSKPSRPTAPKPAFKQRTGNLGRDQAVALYTFDPDQEGDLGFKKGDVITITKRTENKTDWWTGRTEDGRTGIFPR